MSDTKLRELERRWKETGAVEDEAAYLLERVRVGDLTQERLELAAYCGHEGARRGLGQQDPIDPRTFAAGLTQLDRPTRLRVMIALARSILYLSRDQEALDAAEGLLTSIEAWAVCPCLEHQHAAARSAEALPNDEVQRRRKRFSAAFAVVRSFHVLLGLYDGPDGANVCQEPWSFSNNPVDDLLQIALDHADADTVLKAVRDEVAPWLLGNTDPLGPTATT